MNKKKILALCLSLSLSLSIVEGSFPKVVFAEEQIELSAEDEVSGGDAKEDAAKEDDAAEANADETGAKEAGTDDSSAVNEGEDSPETEDVNSEETEGDEDTGDNLDDTEEGFEVSGGQTIEVQNAAEKADANYIEAQCPMGVAVSYYSDIYSRGFAWSTNDEVKKNSLFYVKAVDGQSKEDIDWDSGEVTEVAASMKESVDVANVTWHLFKAHVENLEHGAKYFFRTGNKKTGFSDVGSFVVEDDADKINSLKFVHLTDCQENKEKKYQRWASVLGSAFEVQPDSRFIAFTGDLTDDSHETLNMDQWIWGLDTPKDTLLNSVIEPSSGNHDKYPVSFTDRFDINWGDYDNGGTKDQETGGCYSYTYGNDIVFINLNTRGDVL